MYVSCDVVQVTNTDSLCIQVVALLITFPIGRAWAGILPNWKIFGVSLNPGPFSIKEHVLITIMATVGYQSAYATDIVSVQRVYYNQIFSFGCTLHEPLGDLSQPLLTLFLHLDKWMLVMSTQLIGFSIGGVARRFLVQPPSMSKCSCSY